MPLPTNKTIPLSTTNNEDKDTIILNQNDSVEELTEIMKEICATVGEQIYKFKLVDKTFYKVIYSITTKTF